MKRLTQNEATHMTLVDVVKCQMDTYTCLEETKSQLTISLEKESQTQSELAQTQKALHEVGEELLVAKAERESAKKWKAECDAENDNLRAELAALRQRDTVPVKVRFDVTVEAISLLVNRHSADGYSQLATVKRVMDELAAHAVIDVPAGVATPAPTDEQVEALARVLHKAQDGFYCRYGDHATKFDDYAQLWLAYARAAFKHFGTVPGPTQAEAEAKWKEVDLTPSYRGEKWRAFYDWLLPQLPETAVTFECKECAIASQSVADLQLELDHVKTNLAECEHRIDAAYAALEGE